MSTNPDDRNVLLEDEFLTAARTLAANKRRRQQMDLEDGAAREIIEKVIAEGETGIDENGTPLVQITRGARVWNEDQAKTALSADLLAGITVTKTVTTLDRQRAKDTLAPALYELCTKQNRPSFKVL